MLESALIDKKKGEKPFAANGTSFTGKCRQEIHLEIVEFIVSSVDYVVFPILANLNWEDLPILR